MRDLSKRTRRLIAGATIALLAAGGTGALVLPGTSKASSAPAVQAARVSAVNPDFLLRVCLTIREIKFGPACVTI